ncbi:MAG: maleylpyruvate isomerase family mycothiol-dependent enzyme [Chloroflexi bacterium]|nr:maleylpyruvate isomerase family mycothiol-dependent enzyme [Chloroflexota bacterium]
MNELAPVQTVELLPAERQELLSLLSQLSAEEWALPTVCAGWCVKDLALHVLGDDVGVLSRKRDGHTSQTESVDSWEALVAFLNEWNEQWVAAARRLSPRLLIDLLNVTGDEVYDYFKSIDLNALGGPVSWAGPEPAPVWLDVAREYTERWLHQQQIRDAVERPGLRDRRFLGPVLETFARALPHTYRDAEAVAGTHVKLVVSGEAGGEWSLVRRERGWLLGKGEERAPTATVRLDQNIAWRLFTKGLSEEQAREAVRIEGDEALGAKMLRAVAIIA